MATSGTVRTVADGRGGWSQARVLPTGHYCQFFPGGSARPNTLVLYSPAGAELASHGEAVRDFAVAVAPSGEIFVQWSQFVDGTSSWAWRRWDTGIVVNAPAPPPPPPATSNAAIVAQIRALLDQIK